MAFPTTQRNKLEVQVDPEASIKLPEAPANPTDQSCTQGRDPHFQELKILGALLCRP
jgi:hypothetical protein